MSVPNKSLGAFVPWLKVLQTFDIKPQSQALPTRVNCSCCGGSRLLIFSDFQLGGQWHYCPDCKSKGDMIHLAARCWDVSTESAIRKLDKLGCVFPLKDSIEEAIALYKRYYVDYPRSVNRLWKEARKEIRSKGAGAKGRLQKLGLNTRIPQDWWQEGAGQLIGLSTTSAIYKCFQPDSSEFLANKGYTGVGRNRIFKGRGWDEVLIFPFYDLPARLRMLMFVGRSCDLDEDVAYTSLYFNDASGEAGLFMHPATATSKGTVFAFGKPLVAAKLLFNHLGKKRTPVNIVAWHDEPGRRKTKNAWHMLKDRKIVLCSRDITTSVLVQAVLADGHISTMCPDYSTQRLISEWTRQFPIEVRLEKIENSAVHWKTALEEFVAKGDSEDIEDLFRQLSDVGQNREVVAGLCSPAAQNKIASALYSGITGKSITINSRVVEEREDGWFWRKNNGQEELISEAAFRIDKIIRHKKQDKTLYRGRILFQGTRIEFCESKNKFEKSPLRWMQNFLIDSGYGFMNYASGWSNKAMAIATSFSRPQIVEGITKIGWDRETASMVTPKFCIQQSGEVYSCADLIPNENIPGFKLEPPEPLAPDDLDDLLQDTSENRGFWTLFSVITANIIAPVLNREPTGIGYVGPEDLLDYVVDLCGCQRVLLKDANMTDVMDLEEEHNWPIHVAAKTKTRRAALTQAYIGMSQASRNCILELDDYQADVLGINAGWVIVRGMAFANSQKEGYFRESKPALLSSYLKQTLEKNDLIPDRVAPLSLTILDNLCQWLNDMHLDVTVLNKVRRESAFQQDKSGLFADILCRAISEGLITIKPLEYVEGPDSLWITDSGIFVPVETLNLITDIKSSPRINLAIVKKHLTHAGVLLGGINVRDQEGFLIDESWLTKYRRINQERYVAGS